jgi:glycosyltransferase involved in cell wall biosynthesis
VSEGLSNALLEAMACAVPAIANNACGNSEAIEHGRNGWVVPMPDSRAIAAGIAACVADPEELARFGRAARQRMLDEFEFANTVTRYESVYRELIGRL